jgi:two-component system, NtrC family, sensor kinase
MPETEQKPTQTAAPYPASFYSALLAGLVHKLNNVATVLTGNQSLLLMDEKLPDEVRRSVDQMANATQLLSRILDEAAIAGKGSKLSLESVDLASLLSAIDSPLKIDVVQEARSLIRLKSDPTNLRSVFQELCQNAVAAGATKVSCHLEQDGTNCLIRLRDNGSGIRRELMPRIFDPFFTTKKFGDAFGLGLPRAAAELARIGGTISIISDGKSFTEVKITLPAKA